MGTRTPLILALATLLTVSALLSEGGSRVAVAARTIHLLCGSSGTPCAQDPNVTFTSNSVLTPQQAIVGTGAPADPCFVQDDLGQSGKSRNITTTNSSDTYAQFKITFDLPGMFGNPDLVMLVKVDDIGDASLNGHLLGIFCKPPHGSQLVYSLHDANPAHFVTGTNTLVFNVANNPNGCGWTPTARSGPDDAMNLQFEGAVTYDPPPAGGGLNLGWDDCGGLPASLNRTFACDTNLGTNTLVGSFLAPCCVTAMSANEVVMDIQSTGVTLPQWWGLRTGLCRPGSLTGNFNFTAGPFTCYDYWQGGASGGASMDAPIGNRARIKAFVALPSGSPLITGILEGTEVYSFKLNISNTKTTGLGSCAGCGTGVCIVLQSIKLNQPQGNPYGSKFMSSPAMRAHATWQGGTGVDCYAATPAKNVTWGSIKAIYR